MSYNAQSDTTQAEFQKRTAEAIVLMAQQGLNCIEYYKNTDFRKWSVPHTNKRAKSHRNWEADGATPEKRAAARAKALESLAKRNGKRRLQQHATARES